jgi:predicted PurR-regulated permease PerM
VATFTRAFDTMGDKFGSAMGSMLVDGKSFSKAMTHIWSDMARQVISEIAAMIAKWLVFKTITSLVVEFLVVYFLGLESSLREAGLLGQL